MATKSKKAKKKQKKGDKKNSAKQPSSGSSVKAAGLNGSATNQAGVSASDKAELVEIIRSIDQLANASDYDSALKKALEALERFPEVMELWAVLAGLRLETGSYQESLDAVSKAKSLGGDIPFVLLIEGRVLNAQGKPKDAEVVLRKAAQMDPEDREVRLHLSSSLLDQEKLVDAEMLNKRALNANPKDPWALLALGDVYRSLGEPEMAIEYYDNARALDPKALADVQANMMVMNSYPGIGAEEVFSLCREWSKKNVSPLQANRVVLHNDRNPERKIRLGFLSPSFHRHPVSFFSLAAFRSLNTENVELLAYDNGRKTDEIKNEMRRHAAKWVSIADLSDEAVVNLITEDKIDILFDMAGILTGNRLGVITRKPAPIVVKWVGGQVASTAIDAFDYFLSDWHSTPEGEDRFFSEKLLRMPDDYVCYTPSPDAPPVEELPALKNGFVTFACFNKLDKLNDALVGVWADILNRVKDSRLVFRGRGFGNILVQERLRGRFEDAGGDPNRLDFEGLSSHSEVLSAYNNVDIALDTWPYAGGLTTCEAIWMGVPVVTMAGPTFAGKHSVTHLTNAGLSDWIAADKNEYVEKVVGLASDTQMLAMIRSSLRDRVASSPLCDAPRFARNLERMLRIIWRRWCESKPPVSIALSDNDDGFQEVGNEMRETREATTKISNADGVPDAPKVSSVEIETVTQLIQNESYQEASDLLVQLLDRDSSNAELFYLSAALQKAFGEFQAALDALKKAIELDPSDPEYYKALATVLGEAPEADVAGRVVPKGMSSAQYAQELMDHASLLDMLRYGEAVRSDSKEASELVGRCERALRENSSDSMAFYLLNHALLGRAGADGQDFGGKKELDTRLEMCGWKNKAPVYRYWLKSVEVLRAVADPKVSLVFVCSSICREREKMLGEMKRQLGDKGELVVVSTAVGLADAREFADVLVEVRLNAGDYVTRNLGALFAGSDTLLFLDDWGMLQPGLIDAHLSAYSKYRTHSVRGVYSAVEGYIDTSGNLAEYELGDKVTPAPAPLDGNVSYKAESFFAAGGWPEYLIRGHGGWDLAHRLLEMVDKDPGRQLYLPDAVVEIGGSNPGRKDASEQETREVSLRILHALTPELKNLLDRWDGVQRPCELTGEGKDAPATIKIGETLGVPGKSAEQAGVAVQPPLNKKRIVGEYRYQLRKAAAGRLLKALGDRELVFLKAGRAGNFGIINDSQAKLAESLREFGVPVREVGDAQAAHYSLPDLFSVLRKGNAVVYTGNTGYCAQIRSAYHAPISMFDISDTPVISNIADHPFTDFMASRIAAAPSRGLFLSARGSLTKELRFMRPDMDNVEAVVLGQCRMDFEQVFPEVEYQTGPRVSGSFPEKKKEEQVDRDIDVLAPWKLRLEYTDKWSDIRATLKRLSDKRYLDIGQAVMKEMEQCDYIPSSLPLMIDLYENLFGRPWVPDLPWNEKDEFLFNLAGRLDMIGRREHRRRMLQKLASSSMRGLKVVLTAPPEMRSAFPELANVDHIEMAGYKSHEEMQRLYKRSRYVLNANPSYADGIHERVVHALQNRCAVISDPAPRLEKEFKEGIAMSFVRRGTDLRDLVSGNEQDSLGMGNKGRGRYYAILGLDEVMARRFLSWARYLEKYATLVHEQS